MKIEEMIDSNRADCSGCEACANICPKKVITMVRDSEGFAYPKINPKLCNKCGKCDETCPALNYVKNSPADLPPTFVATHLDNKILLHSASGGMFTALSEIILREGGIVFGASFDENWRVFHTSAQTLDELENLRGSKYVQSKIGDVYQQVKDALESKKVLFSGTPCQCAGLRHFLGGDHENLLTVDIICHGVPSPAIWEYYIDKLDYAHKVTHVNFRSKRNGWSGAVDIIFSDRVSFSTTSGSKNLYVKLFLTNLTLRPSCSTCKFRFPDVQSDLTIGDAWGVRDFAPEMYDSRGVSVIFLHTDKGKEFFNQANVKSKQVNFLDTLKKNKLIIAPTAADLRRADFFDEFVDSADKFAVMQKYFEQDDENIRKQVGKEQTRLFNEAYREIVASVRKKFTQNILIIIAPLDDDAKNFLTEHFAQAAPNSTLYFLRTNDKGELICKENFSALDFPIEPEVAALKEFVEQFNVTQVVASDPLNFDVPAVAEWLKVCGLTVQVLEQE